MALSLNPFEDSSSSDVDDEDHYPSPMAIPPFLLHISTRLNPFSSSSASSSSSSSSDDDNEDLKIAADEEHTDVDDDIDQQHPAAVCISRTVSAFHHDLSCHSSESSFRNNPFDDDDDDDDGEGYGSRSSVVGLPFHRVKRRALCSPAATASFHGVGENRFESQASKIQTLLNGNDGNVSICAEHSRPREDLYHLNKHAVYEVERKSRRLRILSHGGDSMSYDSPPVVVRRAAADNYGGRCHVIERWSVDPESEPAGDDINIVDVHNYLSSEGTAKTLQSCVRVAETMKSEAARTAMHLHEQTDQMMRAHTIAAEVHHRLRTSEKLLGSLGGVFARAWKSKFSSTRRGPTKEENSCYLEKKVRTSTNGVLGVKCHNCGIDHAFTYLSPQTKEEKHEMENSNSKQDNDALSTLSNILNELKDMSIGMGMEISRQNRKLENFYKDTCMLEDRIKNANARGRHLLGKF